jgi:predicted DNA-binding transcriptional regulator AlpA
MAATAIMPVVEPTKVDRRAIDEFVDRHQAADFIGVSARTLDRWHLLRIGPPRIKIGGLVRYSISAIVQWLRSREG